MNKPEFSYMYTTLSRETNTKIILLAAKSFERKIVAEAACGRGNNIEDVKGFLGQGVYNIFCTTKNLLKCYQIYKSIVNKLSAPFSF
jgi:hypothetical protein